MISRHSGLAAAVLALSCSIALACGSTPLGEARVTAIDSATAITLQDGRRIHLAGIAWMLPAGRARALLAEQLLDRRVSLQGEAEPDRHGRLHAFPIVSGSETPIQYALLEQGWALVSGRGTDKACGERLLRAERSARAAGAGAWAAATPLYPADKPAEILRERGRFRIVQGRIESVRESGNLIYVNFSRRWSEDFTATIAKKHQPAFISAGLVPRALAGRTVRIRGYIEERAGPWIEITDPGQIEVVTER